MSLARAVRQAHHGGSVFPCNIESGSGDRQVGLSEMDVRVVAGGDVSASLTRHLVCHVVCET